MISEFKKNKQLFRRVRLGLLTLSGLLSVIALYFIWNYFFSDSTIVLRMSAGRTATRRHQLAEQLRDTVGTSGISLNLVSTAGSEEALQLVDSGALDLAIVSSGILSTGKENVRELAAFHVEPAHFLIRKELADQTGLLRDIVRGKRINLGEPGSSAYALSLEILAFAHMKPSTDSTPGDFQPNTWGAEELSQRAKAIQQATGPERSRLIDDLPDALIMVATLPSRVAQDLIEAADYRLVTLPFSRAFTMNLTRDGNSLNSIIDHSFMEQAVIPAGTYLGSKPIPQQDCQTIGLRLLLVAHKDVPTSAIYRLMSKIFEGEFARRYQPVSSKDKASPYHVHLGAVAYENRNKPYILNELVEMVKKAMSVLGLFSAGALSLFALMRTKSNKSASDYLNEIQQIELVARGTAKDTQAPKENAALAGYLDQRLAKLKSELIHACCKKQFKNEMMLLNILTILVDTRHQVAQLLTKYEEPASADDNDTSVSVLQGQWNHAIAS